MKKWFFSDNGKISKALNFEEAKTYLQKNPNVYGWNPSLTQWFPANCIGEFANILPESDASANIIPEEVVQEFKNKQEKLESQFGKLSKGFNSANKSLMQFRGRIDTYIKLTANLSDDLKGNINGMEKQYAALEKKLGQVREATEIAENEITQAIESFNRGIEVASVQMPIAPRSGSPISTPVGTPVAKIASQPVRNNIKPLFNESNKKAKPKLVKEQYVDDIVDDIIDDIKDLAPVAKKVAPEKKVAPKAEVVVEEPAVAKKEVAEPKPQETVAKIAEKTSEPAEKGIKGMFKSVF